MRELADTCGMSQTPKIEFIRSGSHYVEMTKHHGGNKEEVFLYFKTTWRKEDAFVTMHVNRYEHSSGWSDWRIYAQECKKNEFGEYHTETARQRLGALLKPLCKKWLDSDAYKVSRSDAFFQSLKRKMYDARPYSWGSRDAKELLTKFRSEFTDEQYAHGVAMCEAFDKFAALYEGGDNA